MAIAEHWLDAIFDGVQQNEQKFQNHHKVKAAFAAADAAYLAAKSDSKGTPGLCGKSPAEAARQAFLDSLGLELISGDRT